MSRVSPAGALSTIWTPPCGTSAFAYTGFGPSTCMPPNWYTYWEKLVGYYSPAICPSGFEPGCTRYGTPTGTALDQGPTEVAGETAWLCVVSGFSCAPALSYKSYATSGSVTLAMIQIRWKSSDLSILETHPLTPGLKFVAMTTTPTPSRSSPTGTTGPSPTRSESRSSPIAPKPSPTSPLPVNDIDSSGLSTAAKAGIGAGVGAAVLLLCIAIIIFIRRHRSNHLYQSAEMQVEVRDPSPIEAVVAKASDKTTVMPFNSAASPQNSSPEIDPSYNSSLNTNPIQNSSLTSGSPDSPLPPPSNPPVGHSSAWSTPTQYDTPANSELPEVNPNFPVAVPAPNSHTAPELEALRARREVLNVQRQRILQLQQIEDERAQLDQRISMFEMGNSEAGNSNWASR